ncbi:hypothetical protein LshimejAT787_1002630 [Lyophyllum shimeji]|uniref:Uncharacterized protein n=1 Tax=Lyophyllum shimeji TaxID=47721 RepID=A0A9P3UQG9_LYOSH|nr:hypothetical protein LshimejAT787_1002630 [Lyophyllum shimeji]
MGKDGRCSGPQAHLRKSIRDSQLSLLLPRLPYPVYIPLRTKLFILLRSFLRSKNIASVCLSSAVRVLSSAFSATFVQIALSHR